MADTEFDTVFLGGGLASCLTALRLVQVRPGHRVAIVERGSEICGNHTWCFHQPDVSAAAMGWLTPLLAQSWPGQEVRFPGVVRSLGTPYHAMTSQSLRDAVMQSDIHVYTESEGDVPAAGHVKLSNGEAIRAECIFDGRGFAPSPATEIGYQKFLGLELNLSAPHGLTTPTIMDATVPQQDGYRFVYVLPLGPNRVLVEDTYYSDGADLEHAALETRLADYIAGRGWQVSTEIRREHGVLPIAMSFDADRLWRDLPDVTAPIGLRAHLFHHVTGYSLPFAVQTAERVSGFSGEITTKNMRKLMLAQIQNSDKDQAYGRLLCRMLFRAAEPDQRFKVLQRFYGLNEGLIERFYANRLTVRDKIRIVTGKPPVAIHKAIGCLREHPAPQD
ncbi:MAG: lycopene beta-cyclase CrtY [Marinosulfonomonas sp.]